MITQDFMISHFGSDLVYGHIVESGRHLIISAGLGTSMAPVVGRCRNPEHIRASIVSKCLA